MIGFEPLSPWAVIPSFLTLSPRDCLFPLLCSPGDCRGRGAGPRLLFPALNTRPVATLWPWRLPQRSHCAGHTGSGNPRRRQMMTDRTRRGCCPCCPTLLPPGYLQEVTLLHIEMQPVLQLLQVPGLLQDALALAKSLQATCFPAVHEHSPDLRDPCPSPHPPRACVQGGQGSWPPEPHLTSVGTQFLAAQPPQPPYPSWLYF